MKKVFVVSKTHLDLGFTDYAETIRRKYIDTFIPEAIDLAEKVNTEEKNISYGPQAPGLLRKHWVTKSYAMNLVLRGLFRLHIPLRKAALI